MSEVNFGADQKPVIDVPATVIPNPPGGTPATTGDGAAPASQVPAPVTPPGTSTAVATTGPILGDKLPEFKDIILPRINISQNIGQLKDSFPPGSLVLAQSVALFSPPVKDPKTQTIVTPATPPALITVLGFRDTRFCEKVSGGVRGMIVNTEAEVAAKGGTLDYQEWELKKAAGMKLFQPLADALCAVERPANAPDDGTLFVYEIDGKKYALAMWAMRGTSYTAAAKRVFFTARLVGCLKERGYPSWNYAVSVREESYPNGNKAWIPVCVPNKPSSPEFIAFVQNFLGR